MHSLLIIGSAFIAGISFNNKMASTRHVNAETCAHYYDSALQLTIYTSPTTQVEYPGGFRGLFKQTAISVTFKEVGISNDKVILTLYIDEDGNMVAAKALDAKVGEYSALEKKVIEKLKPLKWKAATCNNQKVASTYLYVVQFCFLN